MPLYPSKMLQARERALTSYSYVVFNLDSHLSPSRSWEHVSNLASPCLGRELKAKVATIPIKPKKC
jgi:hypothetical protein